MEVTAARRRAPGMSPERRREMIVQAALPLLAEFGSAVTTSQVARAAGIGEATIFRAFADKDELLDACMAEALRPGHVLEQIAAIPLDQPLADRLAEAATAMEAHMTRLGAVTGAVMGVGRRGPGRSVRDGPGPGFPERDPGHPEPGRPGQGPVRSEQGRDDLASGRGDGGRRAGEDDRDASLRQTREVLAELFEPERASLRLAPDQLAGIFLGFIFTRATGPAGPGVPVPGMRESLDVFLHGALSKEGSS